MASPLNNKNVKSISHIDPPHNIRCSYIWNEFETSLSNKYCILKLQINSDCIEYDSKRLSKETVEINN